MEQRSQHRRALITGWFSFQEVIATVGDQLGAEVAARWLQDAGIECDLAWAPYMQRGLAWERATPEAYDTLLFVSGPLQSSRLLDRLLERYRHCHKVALNVSVIDRKMAERFDVVIARDDEEQIRPDIAMASKVSPAPLIGVAFVPPQREYSGGRHEDTAATIWDWLKSRQLARAELVMDLYEDSRYPRQPAQVISIILHADLVVSMRLHALVLALANSKPVIAVDPVEGGAKVAKQAYALDWPAIVCADELIRNPGRLDELWAFCQSADARTQIAKSKELASDAVEKTRWSLLNNLDGHLK